MSVRVDVRGASGDRKREREREGERERERDGESSCGESGPPGYVGRRIRGRTWARCGRYCISSQKSGLVSIRNRIRKQNQRHAIKDGPRANTDIDVKAGHAELHRREILGLNSRGKAEKLDSTLNTIGNLLQEKFVALEEFLIVGNFFRI